MAGFFWVCAGIGVIILAIGGSIALILAAGALLARQVQKEEE